MICREFFIRRRVYGIFTVRNAAESKNFRKSFRREELDEKYYLPKKSGFLVPYLEGLKLDLETRVLP